MEVYSEIEDFELHLNKSAKGFLKETSKWTYFLSILGYIGIGFIVLAAIFAGAIFGTIGGMMPGEIAGKFGSAFGIIITVIYLLIVTLYFFPVYYLNKFSSKLKLALRNNDPEILANSFEYLKSHYKYIGIMILIILSFYVLILLGFLIIALTIGIN